MDISSSFGFLVLGMMLNLILYGFMFMQCYLYMSVFKRDATWIKIFVAYLLLADTLNTAFTAAILYEYLIAHYGEVDYLSHATWLFSTDPALTGIISCSVQLFFAYRVKRLTGNTWLAVAISLLAVVAACGALGSAIAVNWWHDFDDFRNFKAVVVIWLVCAAVADVLVTGVLVWYLRRKRTGLVGTDLFLDRIVRLTIQTGLLTAVFAVVDVVLFLSSPTTLHFLFNMPLAKLYTNSLMSNLNSRSGWEGSDSKQGAPGSLSERGNGMRLQQLKHSGPDFIMINKDVTTVTDSPRFPQFSGYRGSREDVSKPRVLDPPSSHDMSEGV